MEKLIDIIQKNNFTEYKTSNSGFGFKQIFTIRFQNFEK
jgi:hypothetical protein